MLFSARDTSPDAKDAPLDADKVAARIEAAGMSGVALVLLQAFKPLAWMGGQVAWMLQPFVDATGRSKSTSSISGLVRLLENEHGVDDIVESLAHQKPVADHKP